MGNCRVLVSVLPPIALEGVWCFVDVVAVCAGDLVWLLHSMVGFI